jgi:DNA-binding MarR family transcriptional regulator
MKPVDYRDETWESLQDRLRGLRGEVLAALKAHGPCTTRDLARRSGIDILTVRPRVTELLQLGWAVCTAGEGGEGIYRAASYAEARRTFETEARRARDAQLTLF